MSSAAVSGARSDRNIGLALRGVGLWQLALGGLVLAMSLSTTNGGEEQFFALLGGMFLTVFALALVGSSWAVLGKGFFQSPWLLTLGAGLVGTIAAGGTIFLTPLIAEGIGIGVAYLIVSAVLRIRERGLKWESQGAAEDQCGNCGQRLTVNDKMRNRGIRLCWECYLASPDARRIRLLDHIRDEGLITDEEYESKRAGLPSGP